MPRCLAGLYRASLRRRRGSTPSRPRRYRLCCPLFSPLWDRSAAGCFSFENGTPAGVVKSTQAAHMLICLLLRHIMDDDLENPRVEGTGQNVRQLRRQPARSKRIVVRLLDEPRRAGRVNLDELVQEFLIDLRLAARMKNRINSRFNLPCPLFHGRKALLQSNPCKLIRQDILRKFSHFMLTNNASIW